MDPERWRRIEELFHAAAALEGDERRDLLDRACAGDPDLRREISELLRHDAAGGGSIAAAVHEAARQAGLGAPQAEEPELPPGTRIGRYRIVAAVGRGGMGDVYEAEQESPLRRRVALKLIKTGMDTRAVVARFESERQALAMMDHPAIARVFDAGATERGRPYFTMEFVRGVPITRYCDERLLGTRERLELFLQVCAGVQHAHQKGIIHRDLKPSNVLVGELEGRAQPKIIDFGIAKATQPRPTGGTLLTEAGQMVGTPEYMSPEQAGMSGAGIDTRTDVYSLGVVLYELLAGAHPLDVARRRASGIDDLRRAILEIDPPRPSTRAGGRGQAEEAAARSRGADRRSLARQLRGDLDGIAMTALEKDPARRYASPADLAADVRRHLRDEPVLARASGVVYRSGKFVRRHKVGAAAGLLVFAAVVAGIAGTAAGLLRARRAERQARQEAATAGQVSKFLIDLFEVSDPDQARGRTITAREILDRGARQIDALEAQPAVRARLMQTIGSVYQNLGAYEPARRLLEESLRIRREALYAAHPDVAESLRALGNFETDAGAHERAVALLREALEPRQGLDGGDGRAAAIVMHDLGHALYLLGRYDEAEPLYRRAIAVLEGDPVEEDSDLAMSTGSLAQLLHFQGNFEEAERLYRSTVPALQSALGKDHPEVLRARHNLATVLHDRRKLDEAEALYRESLAQSETVQGRDHPDIADTLVNLARLLREKGDLAGAEETLRRCLAIDVRVHGQENENVAYDLKELAHLEVEQGKVREAEATFRRSLAIYRRAAAKDSPYIAVTLNGLGGLLLEGGRPGEAEPLLRESVSIAQASLPADHWVLFTARSLLGATLGGVGRHPEGEPLVVGSYAGFEESLGESDPRTRAALRRIIRFYETWGRADRTADWRARLPPAGE
jgi:non-specific serine/threonine protein kinase/serine/threonine-protein kinase